MRLTEIAEGQALMVPVKGHPEMAEIPHGETFNPWVQEYVKGDQERALYQPLSFTHLGCLYYALVNEEGRVLKMPYNELGSHYVNIELRGNVIIINSSDLK